MTDAGGATAVGGRRSSVAACHFKEK